MSSQRDLLGWREPNGASSITAQVERFLGDFMLMVDEEGPAISRPSVRGGEQDSVPGGAGVSPAAWSAQTPPIKAFLRKWWAVPTPHVYVVK